jgi:tetratricopeptide (TPR) repeat protein
VSFLSRLRNLLNLGQRRLVSLTNRRVPTQELRAQFPSGPRTPNIALAGLGEVCRLALERGDLAEARKVAEEIKVFAATHKVRHNAALFALHWASEAYEQSGEFKEALQFREEILSQERKKHGRMSAQALVATEWVARDLRKTGEASKAVELMEWVVSVRTKLRDSDSRETLEAATSLGIALVEQGDLPRADVILRDVVAKLGDENPEARLAASWLASNCRKLGEHDQSLTLRQQILSVSRQTYGPEDLRTLDDVDQVAVTLWAMGEREQARTLMEGSLASRERTLGDEHPDTARAKERLDALRHEMGSP